MSSRANFAPLLALSFVLSQVLLIQGCTTGGGGSRYSQAQDSGPSGPLDVSHIPDAVPRLEPRTKAGNKSPYTVRGKTYYVMPNAEGYQQRGDASWYGKKFHGHLTSNGEIYDMYGMTAAHKTLPIPSYVRVTNRVNGRSVIVRVNDRGPFHPDRIIDLSYTAASKLGFVQQGTAPVRIEVITPTGHSVAATPQGSESIGDTQYAAKAVASAAATALPKAPAPKRSGGFALPDNTYVQAGAFKSQASAESLKSSIAKLTDYRVRVWQKPQVDALFRVQIGPITDKWESDRLIELLQEKYALRPERVID